MQVKDEKKSKLAGELGIIPMWAWILAAVVFVIAQVIFNVVISGQADAPVAALRALMGLMAGGVMAVYLLFLGYVNRDSRRRGMSPLIWTAVAIVIPNGLGILLYFILRTPRQASCPQCGKAVQSGFDFCPACSYRISPQCPNCQRSVGENVVGAGDSYCPYCGALLRRQDVSTPINLPV